LLLFITAVLLLSYHSLSSAKSPIGDYNLSEDDVVATVKGSLVHYIGLLSLAFVAIASLMRHRGTPCVRIGGPVGWPLLSFVVWAFISPLWAEDLQLTLQRLAGFGILCIAALAVVRRASLRDIILWTCATTALFLLIGIVAELVFGTFTPFAAGYRFAGTLPPNNTGIECGLLLLSSVAAADVEKRRRAPFWACALFGFIFLILSGSRTALAAALLALGVYLCAVASRRAKAAFGLGFFTALCVALVTLLLLGSASLPGLKSAILLGRDDPEKINTLSDRSIIWEKVGYYIRQRPVLGYGYGGFWTPNHINMISDAKQGGIPNAHSTYIDYLLTLGTVGLAAYALLLIAGTTFAFRLFRQSRSPTFAFCTALFVFCALDGLLESAIADGGTVKFLFMIVTVRLALVPDQQNSSLALRSGNRLNAP
jgi:O-antigen ligase